MEGLEDLTVEQAYELTDASAERSAAGSVIALEASQGRGIPQEQHRPDEG